jgi:hypothetical protein
MKTAGMAVCMADHSRLGIDVVGPLLDHGGAM